MTETVNTCDMAEETIDDLRLQLDASTKALTRARTGLMQIINTQPTRFRAGPGSTPTSVQTYQYMRRKAESTLLAMTDLETV